MSEEAHQHRFNATRITTSRNPVLRCACGVWSSAGRVLRNERPYSTGSAKSMESQLARATREAAGEPESTITAFPRLKLEKPNISYMEPSTTPAVDSVLRGRRRP